MMMAGSAGLNVSREIEINKFAKQIYRHRMTEKQYKQGPPAATGGPEFYMI